MNPPTGRIAGIDFGTVRIGVAISDPMQSIASPLDNYNRRDQRHDAAYFRHLVEEQAIARFVVGLPVHLDGHESEKSIQAREFGDWLRQTTGIPVDYFDERFTTSQAQRYLIGARLSKKKRKARLDKLAAQIMLAAYLESDCRGEDDPGSIDD